MLAEVSTFVKQDADAMLAAQSIISFVVALCVHISSLTFVANSPSRIKVFFNSFVISVCVVSFVGCFGSFGFMPTALTFSYTDKILEIISRHVILPAPVKYIYYAAFVILMLVSGNGPNAAKSLFASMAAVLLSLFRNSKSVGDFFNLGDPSNGSLVFVGTKHIYDNTFVTRYFDLRVCLLAYSILVFFALPAIILCILYLFVSPVFASLVAGVMWFAIINLKSIPMVVFSASTVFFFFRKDAPQVEPGQQTRSTLDSLKENVEALNENAFGGKSNAASSSPAIVASTALFALLFL